MALVKFIKSKNEATALSESTTSGNTDNIYFATDTGNIIKNGRFHSGNQLSAKTWTAPTTKTVANYKDALVDAIYTGTNGFGHNITVGSDLILNWDDDSHTVVSAASYEMTNIGGYAGSNYGQWLLSSYGDSRLGVIGRRNGSWSSLKWIAWTTDIPTESTVSGWGFTKNGDTKVTQTVTSSANASPRPLIIGDSFSDAATFAPTTTTSTTYATHLAKFYPSTGILSVVGLKKMKDDGTMDTASNSKVWNTNGGVSDLPTVDKTSVDGALGVVANTSTGQFYRKDGTWASPSNTAQLRVSDTTNKRINTVETSGSYIQFIGGANKFTVTDVNNTSFEVGITPSISNATTSTAGLMSAADKANLEALKSDRRRYIPQDTTTPLKCHERWQGSSTTTASLPIYEVVSTLSNGYLTNVTGKAKYILCCTAVSDSKCIPCVCTKDASTRKWKPSAIDGTTITSGYIFYVKFVYNNQSTASSQGSPNLTNGS